MVIQETKRTEEARGREAAGVLYRPPIEKDQVPGGAWAPRPASCQQGTATEGEKTWDGVERWGKDPGMMGRH
jgi:hypothetical protein